MDQRIAGIPGINRLFLVYHLGITIVSYTTNGLFGVITMFLVHRIVQQRIRNSAQDNNGFSQSNTDMVHPHDVDSNLVLCVRQIE